MQDFLSRALDTAKALQHTVNEALEKGREQAQPLVAEAVVKAQELQKSVAEQAVNVSEAAKPHFETAGVALGDFINAGKDVLAKTVENAQAGLAPLADKARDVVHASAAAVHEATKPQDPPKA